MRKKKCPPRHRRRSSLLFWNDYCPWHLTIQTDQLDHHRRGENGCEMGYILTQLGPEAAAA